MLKAIKSLLDRAAAILVIAAKRLIAQRGLALATLLGLVVVIGLIVSMPLYAESIYYRMLSQGLFSDRPGYMISSARPPVALLFRYNAQLAGPCELEHVVPVNAYLQEDVYRHLRLPPSPESASARLYSTGVFGFYTEADAAVIPDKMPQYWIGFAAMASPETHTVIVEGRQPAATSVDDAPFEVVVSRFLAERMGLQLGEVMITYDLRALHRYEENPAQFEVRVVGIWEPRDPDAEFWQYTPLPLDNTLLVAGETFTNWLSPRLLDEIYQAIWYLPLDSSRIYLEDVNPLLLRFEQLQRRVGGILPTTTLTVSPVNALRRYRDAAQLLGALLMTFSVPVISLVMTFIGLVVALNVERQRGQIAALRSRGAAPSQVLGIAAVESGLLGLVALAIAMPVGLGIAYAIGQTRSFLDFSVSTNLRVGMTGRTLRIGLMAVLATLVLQVVPLISATRQTVVTYRNERARRLRPPWWQRVGLDLLLLLPAAYGTYLVDQQGAVFVNAQEAAADPLQNPLLFLLPALSLLAGTLIVLRVLPLIMQAIAWVTQLTRSSGILLAARQLARSPSLYTAPLALLILTLSLSTYTASLAATLDNHLHDQQYYWVGADASLVDIGETTGTSGPPVGAPVQADSEGWQFLPVSEYRKLPGVEAAARVGHYRGRIQTSEGHVTSTYIGVDRADFGRVAYWRDDFADDALGGLMNLLALRQDAILLPSDFMAEHILNVGDRVSVGVRAYGQLTTMAMTVVGSFDYFPSWDPEAGPLAVGNLDYLYQEAQFQFPYRVWLDTEPGIDEDRLEQGLTDLNLNTEGLAISEERILTEQLKPERQGLLGLLSVGFSAAAVLTALGFVLYALFSFRRRAVELGVLRAVGLSERQMSVFVAAELAFLLGVGGAAGTGLGIWASNLYIPYLQIGGSVTSQIPPFVVEIAWPALIRIYVLFGLLFVVALIVLIRMLHRTKLFQAIKLGEAV
ncbi:MAG: ABC transporter permease [Anaerolineae bacterium]|nr:ABC transporter permease [Anaerolineae bacterium]